MCKLNVLILSKFVTPLTKAFGKMGRVHLVDAVAQSPRQLLDGVDRHDEIQRVERLLDRCEAMLDLLGVDREVDVGSGEGLSRGRIDSMLSDVEEQYQRIDERLNELLQRSGLLERESKRLRSYPVQGVRLDSLRDLSHLYIVTGRLSPSLLPSATEQVGDRGIILHDENDREHRGKVLILSSRRNRWAVDTELSKLGFSKEELPEGIEATAKEEQDAIEGRLSAMRRDVESCRADVLELNSRYGGPLLAAKQQLQGSLAILRAQQSFGRSTHLYCISGWIPRDAEGAVREVVERVTSGTGIVEMIDAAEDDRVRDGQERVPVMFEDHRWLRPFQTLITTFGAPRYNEIDPSLFVAASFVLMFGLMFGDVGQGAVIVGLGAWLQRTQRPAFAPYRKGGILLIFCGISAMIFGVLYGSVFGYEGLPFLQPIWLRPLHDVTRLLSTAVFIGIIFITIALIINVINKLRNRHWFESVFDKFGVLGIIFYWGAIGIGLKAAKGGELDARQMVLLVILPLALLFIREPLHNLLQRKKLFDSDMFSFILEAAIETMETVTTFLGSTVSFVRVGAFALSHAALCLAIYSVNDIIGGLPGATLWSALVIIIGNVLVIFMEGMVAMIQGIRLEYYELFSKYFPGDGVLYHPFSLSPEPAEPETKGEQEA